MTHRDCLQDHSDGCAVAGRTFDLVDANSFNDTIEDFVIYEFPTWCQAATVPRAGRLFSMVKIMPSSNSARSGRAAGPLEMATI